MASEPDDYQSISDDCPGYMVLIPAGIICTRCEGEKRHKRNDCPKTASAAETYSNGATDGTTDNGDSGMESLSDTDSLSSESTVRSESPSETQVANTTPISRRGFAHGNRRPEPDHTSRSSRDRGQIRQCQTPNTTISQSETQNRRNVSSIRSRTSIADLSSINKTNSSIKQGSINSRILHHKASQQVFSYDRKRPSKPIAESRGKFDYSNTTCPSSFGFGRLPSESMG